MQTRDEVWNFHKCKLCNYQTNSPQSILSHMTQHKTRSKNHRFVCILHSPENYQCEKCHCQSDFKVFLTKHFDTVHRTKDTHHYPTPELRYCIHCDFQTYSSLVLLKHRKSCRNRINPVKYIKAFKCQHCWYEAKSLYDLHAHLCLKRRLQQPKQEKILNILCVYCSYKTHRNALLKEHILRKHTPPDQIKWRECDHCPYKTMRKRDFDIHMLQKHTPEDQISWFECDQCPYRSIRKENWKKHMVQKHTPSEQIHWLTCEHCNFRTVRSGDLRMHTLRKHTPAEQMNWVKCEFCSYKTVKKWTLKVHMRHMHTPSEQINWFKCELCCYKAKEKSTLNKHVLGKHKKQQNRKS